MMQEIPENNKNPRITKEPKHVGGRLVKKYRSKYDLPMIDELVPELKKSY